MNAYFSRHRRTPLRTMKQAACTLLLLALGTTFAGAGELAIDTDRITVSGISAGGAMAHQLHVAYPDIFSGAAVIAGPPYGCADGNLGVAFARCMAQMEGEYALAESLESIRSAAAEGRIGDPDTLANDRVWLFHGTSDTIVAGAVSDALAALYARLVEPGNLLYVNDFEAAHLFPTRDRGSDCLAAQSPFIGACGYDAAGELLRHLYPGIEDPGEVEIKRPVETGLPGAAAAFLSQTAWIYVPRACNGGARSCALHLVLHGCGQSAEQIGGTFIEQAGYLPWAEANAIVLAFPQVTPSAGNPLACWDWWGYTGPDYALRDGPQMRVLADWLRSLSGPSE